MSISDISKVKSVEFTRNNFLNHCLSTSFELDHYAMRRDYLLMNNSMTRIYFQRLKDTFYMEDFIHFLGQRTSFINSSCPTIQCNCMRNHTGSLALDD